MGFVVRKEHDSVLFWAGLTSQCLSFLICLYAIGILRKRERHLSKVVHRYRKRQCQPKFKSGLHGRLILMEKFSREKIKQYGQRRTKFV